MSTNAEAQDAFGEPAKPPKPPRGWTYLVAVPLIVLGIAAGIWWFVDGFTGLGDNIDKLQRVPVPGERVVTLSEGDQSIYFESSDGQDVAVPAMNIRIRPPDGEPLALRGNSGSTKYSVDGYDGQSIAGFTTPHEGRYTVVVSNVRGNVPAEPVIALGEGVGGHIVVTVLGGLGLIFGGFLAAGLWIAITAYRRRKRS